MEDFVTYDIAVKLKEKGFIEECLAYYTTDIDFFYNTTLDSEVITGFKSFNSNPNSICWKRIDAPTIAQVLKWLRNEKRLHIEIAIWDSKYLPAIVYIDIPDDDIVHCNQSILLDNEITFDSYEEAAIAGIEYVLNNLI